LRVAGFALIAYYSLITFTDIFVRTLATIGSIIAAIVSVYTASYTRHKYGVPYLQLLVDSFSLSIIFTFTSYYLIEFVAFWIIAELLGFVLIAFD
jgi:hypothetical protein